jgi:hypothetical protein
MEFNSNDPNWALEETLQNAALRFIVLFFLDMHTQLRTTLLLREGKAAKGERIPAEGHWWLGALLSVTRRPSLT